MANHLSLMKRLGTKQATRQARCEPIVTQFSEACKLNLELQSFVVHRGWVVRYLAFTNYAGIYLMLWISNNCSPIYCINNNNFNLTYQYSFFRNFFAWSLLCTKYLTFHSRWEIVDNASSAFHHHLWWHLGSWSHVNSATATWSLMNLRHKVYMGLNGPGIAEYHSEI